MKYIKLTLQYLFSIEKGRRALILILLALPLALFTAYVVPMDRYIKYFADYTVGDMSYVTVWKDNVTATRGMFLTFLDAILLFLTLSCLISVVSRSIRVGKFFVERIGTDISDGSYPALFAICGLVGLYLIAKVIYIAFLVVLQGVADAGASLVLASIITALFYFLLILLCICTLLWIPIMTNYGVKPMGAFVRSFRKSYKNKWSFGVAIALPLAIVTGANIGGNLLGDTYAYIINTVMYALLFAYLSVLPFVTYASIENIERPDLTREFILRNK